MTVLQKIQKETDGFGVKVVCSWSRFLMGTVAMVPGQAAQEKQYQVPSRLLIDDLLSFFCAASWQLRVHENAS